MLTDESPSCKVWLVRHGQTDFNRRGLPQGQLDIPLDECGIEQAVLCGKRLKDVDLDFILSSDLSRAYKTAESISAHHPELEIERDSELREIYRGDRQGKSRKEYHRLLAEGKVKDFGESVTQFCNRIAEWWDGTIRERFVDIESLKREKTTNILVVTHGAFIGCLCDILERTHVLDNPHAFDLADGVYNTSVTLLEVYKDGSVTLMLYSDDKHLDPEEIAEEMLKVNADLDSLSLSA